MKCHTYNQRINCHSAPHCLGFTLIELMVVVVVLGILASIAYPSYTQYVQRGKRSQATQLMMKIASRQEQYVLDARAYGANLTGTPSIGLGATEDTFTCSATQCANAYYTITQNVTAGPPPSYTITATAIGSQASDGNLTLDNLGSKTPADKWK